MADDDDFEWDDDDQLGKDSGEDDDDGDDGRTSLLQAFLLGLEQELNEIEPREEGKLLDFAPFFARFLSKLAEAWEKTDFSLIIYRRSDNKPIVRKLGDSMREVKLFPTDDVLVVGDRLLQRIEKERQTLARQLPDYLDEEVLAHLDMPTADIPWAMEHSINALMKGYEIVEPYRGGYTRARGAQDRRQHKNKQLSMKVGI